MLITESDEELKSLLMRVKREEWNLKLNIHKTKILASGPITLWQIEGGKVEAVADCIFLGSKITANSHCTAMKIKDACSLEGKLWWT